MVVDIFCEDPEEGHFRVHLTTRTRRWFLGYGFRDRPDLEDLEELVLAQLRSWDAQDIVVQLLDPNYDPMSGGA